ncbi:hypothetical protein TW95_gp1381 [Pandoravirus inopinatum]|uniref:Transmembrane protein n=1 Tax=Pandoravirus inopinatum TaxID=1605721 RepID=A0A0B5J873_9VIRU|nr:hypothetical protein TW95_gp1381 [Pandoravirus inopinatum]AJF98115.1 hypothetical protein [Pandoravirus inopinatum]
MKNQKKGGDGHGCRSRSGRAMARSLFFVGINVRFFGVNGALRCAYSRTSEKIHPRGILSPTILSFVLFRLFQITFSFSFWWRILGSIGPNSLALCNVEKKKRVANKKIEKKIKT